MAQASELFEIKNRNVYFQGTRVFLPYPVVQHVFTASHLIVRVINSKPKPALSRNVYAFNTSGLMAWQIKSVPRARYMHAPYTNIRLSAGGSLLASNWSGGNFDIDVETGEVREVQQLSGPSL